MPGPTISQTTAATGRAATTNSTSIRTSRRRRTDAGTSTTISSGCGRGAGMVGFLAESTPRPQTVLDRTASGTRTLHRDMARSLVIVESPAKARTIEGILGDDF